MRYGTHHFRSERDALKYYAYEDADIDDIRAKVAEGAIAIGYPSDLKPGHIFRWDKDGRGEITEREPQEPVFGLFVRPRDYQCQIADCLHVHSVSTNHTDACYSICPKCNWRGGFTIDGSLYNAMHKERPHAYVGPAIVDADRNPHATRK